MKNSFSSTVLYEHQARSKRNESWIRDYALSDGVGKQVPELANQGKAIPPKPSDYASS